MRLEKENAELFKRNVQLSDEIRNMKLYGIYWQHNADDNVVPIFSSNMISKDYYEEDDENDENVEVLKDVEDVKDVEGYVPQYKFDREISVFNDYENMETDDDHDIMNL